MMSRKMVLFGLCVALAGTRAAAQEKSKVVEEVVARVNSDVITQGDLEKSKAQLVDEVRKSLAIEHLSRPGTSATDVAFLLGFSEPSAFTRAFRRWTGTAPTEFRAASA